MITGKGSNLPIIQKQNSSLIKEIIYKFSPISRTDIAHMLSLTTPTITTNVSRLIEDGFVTELPSLFTNDDKAPGRKPIMLDIAATARYVVGAELGPYQTTLVVCDMRGNIIVSETESPAPPGYADMLDFLAGRLENIAGKSGVDRSRILGAGIGIPGLVDPEQGRLLGSVRAEWIRKPLAQDLSAKTGFSVSIDNNVQARAMYEDLFNRGADADSFAYYFVSRGIACPLFIRSNMVSGISTGAGEVGHMVVELDGPVCETCGNNGCLEAVASENAIIGRAAKIMRSGVPTMLGQICADKERPDISDVLKAQECGDIAVTTIIKEAVGYLGVNLANIINFISPHVVFIDAAIFGSSDNRELMLATVKKNLFVLSNQDVKIEFLEPDPLRGAMGGVALVIRRRFIEDN